MWESCPMKFRQGWWFCSSKIIQHTTCNCLGGFSVSKKKSQPALWQPFQQTTPLNMAWALLSLKWGATQAIRHRFLENIVSEEPSNNKPVVEHVLGFVFLVGANGCHEYGRKSSFMSSAEIAWQKSLMKLSSWEFGLSPLPVTVTTKIIPFLIGNPYKPSFTTVTVRGTTQGITVSPSVSITYWWSIWSVYVLWSWGQSSWSGSDPMKKTLSWVVRSTSAFGRHEQK